MGYWVKTAFQGVASAAARRSLDLSVLLVTEYILYYIIISLEFQVIQE